MCYASKSWVQTPPEEYLKEFFFFLNIVHLSFVVNLNCTIFILWFTMQQHQEHPQLLYVKWDFSLRCRLSHVESSILRMSFPSRGGFEEMDDVSIGL